MADNVVRFRKVEKQPEKTRDKPPGKQPQWPDWLPWAVVVVLAAAIVTVQQSGVFGG